MRLRSHAVNGSAGGRDGFDPLEVHGRYRVEILLSARSIRVAGSSLRVLQHCDALGPRAEAHRPPTIALVAGGLLVLRPGAIQNVDDTAPDVVVHRSAAAPWSRLITRIRIIMGNARKPCGPQRIVPDGPGTTVPTDRAGGE